jgi:hypothetical protein
LNKKIIGILVCILFFGASVIPVSGEIDFVKEDIAIKESMGTIGDLIIQPSSQDSYVSIYNADTNYGSDTGMWLLSTPDEGAREFSYVQFDLSSIPSDVTITAASLYLRCTASGTPADVFVYEVESEWDENTITWNSGPNWYTSPSASSFVGSTGWKDWHVTDHVNDWYTGVNPNYGFVVISHDFVTHSSKFATKEYGESEMWPKLEIVYAEADLICEGDLSWIDVRAGETVTGSFTVENVGDPGSELDWEIDDWPKDWGTDWSFTPESGIDLTPEDGPVTIQVQVDAPKVNNGNFAGHVKITNTNDAGDYCIINILLTTPREKFLNRPIINFLQSHPDLFPFLQKLIQNLGL